MEKIITLSGGFHNCNPIKVMIQADIAEKLIKGEISIVNPKVLTKLQRNRLDRHFCGIKGCMCGGVARAEITVE